MVGTLLPRTKLVEIQSAFDARSQIMTTPEEKSDLTEGENPEEPILNKLIKPLVKPSPEGIEEDDQSREHPQEEQKLPPGMPPLI